jgi:nucleotide-binding universal stress UspA family protein
MITAAICFDGVEDDSLIEAVREFLPSFAGVEAWCSYGDAAERFIEDVAERHHGPHPPHPSRHPVLDAGQADAIARRGVALLQRAGFEAVPRTFGGRDPGHALAAASGPDRVLVLSASHREGRGPKSIGHTARFVLDHARGPVLLLRTR